MDEQSVKLLLKLRVYLERSLAEKEAEIEELKDYLQEIDGLIHNHSFKSAKGLLGKKMNTEDFIKEHEKSQITNVENSRAIYSKNDKLLCKIQFSDNKILLRFTDPEYIGLTQEKYIERIVQPILLDLKEEEENLDVEVKKKKLGEEELIETIVLSNIKKFESFENFCEQVEDLLGR